MYSATVASQIKTSWRPATTHLPRSKWRRSPSTNRKCQAEFSFRLVKRGEVGGDFLGGAGVQGRAGTVESGKAVRAHAGLFDAMLFFGRDEPAAGLLTHEVLLAVNQSANGQTALVGFGHGRHVGNFP